MKQGKNRIGNSYFGPPCRPVFLVRDSIYLARYTCVLSSVRPSVCHTGESVQNG